MSHPRRPCRNLLRRTPRILATLLLAWSVSMQLTGCCTAIGYVTGSVVDDARARRTMQRIETGTAVEVRLRSGDTVRGTFVSTREVPATDYAVRYERWREGVRTVPPPPGLGESLRLTRPHGEAESGRFTGLRTDQLLLEDEAGHERGIPVAQLTDRTAIASPRDALWRLALFDAPRRDALVVATSEGERVIGSERITAILVGRRTTGRWVGTSLGLTADALVLYALLSIPRSVPLRIGPDDHIP